MAGLLLNVNSGECVLVATVAKTLLQCKCAANQRGRLKSLKIFGKQPAGGVDAMVKIRITRSTANFGTGTAVASPAKANPSNPETPQTAIATNFTVEPTAPTDSGLWWEVQPQAGIIEYLPLPFEVDVPGGASINVEATSAGTPTLLITAQFEE